MTTTRRRGVTIGKSIAAIALAIVAYVGIQYGSLLNDMSRGGTLYSQGDIEGALRTYQAVEQRIRAHGALRIIPGRDRHNLFLNQARLLYALKKYDEAADALAREDEISGATTDARFFLLRGNIVYRRAFKIFQDSAPKVYTEYSPKKDEHLLEENLLGAEDSFRESLRLDPDDWDAKYNFEFVAIVRKNLAAANQEQLRLLEKAERPETKQLPPESAG